MSDQPFTRLWSMRLMFAGITCVILFFNLLPLETSPRRWAGPDLLLGFAFAWSLRRPEYVPTFVLAGMFLLADLLLFRPPGLWAAIALIGCEHLKGRARALRDGSFANEWLAVAMTMAFVAVCYRLVMMITLMEPPGLGLSILELLMSILFYPAVVAITRFGLGVRKAPFSELDTSGGRL